MSVRSSRVDWARAVGILDPATGAFTEIGPAGGAELHLPEARRAALRELLFTGAADVVAGLVAGEAKGPGGTAPRFRETLLQDSRGFLFCKALRDGRLLLVETAPVENPGHVWAQVKVLIPSLAP